MNVCRCDRPMPNRHEGVCIKCGKPLVAIGAKRKPGPQGDPRERRLAFSRKLAEVKRTDRRIRRQTAPWR